MYVIAEIGTNHNGSEKTAIELVTAAAKTGVQAVKMNYWKADLLASKKSKWHDRCKELELPISCLVKARTICQDHGIDFIVAPWSHELVGVSRFVADAFKVASGELTNTKLLSAIRETRIKSFLSTGMATIDEIDKAVLKLNPDCVMHCVSLYPTPLDNANLSRISFLKDRYFQRCIGYSDHTVSGYASILAYAMGAEVIEKHFNLAKNQCFDLAISINEHDMKSLIEKLKEVGRAKTWGFLPDQKNIKTLRRGQSGLRE